jgi:hypothetical protein
MKSSGQLKMKRELRAHPRGSAAFTAMILGSQYQWRALSQELTNRRQICYQQCDDEDEAWLYWAEISRGVLDECYALRNIGAERSSTKTPTIKDDVRIMWGALKTYQLMEEFMAHAFHGHPKLASYALGHLFRNTVAPKALTDLKTAITTTKKMA